MQQILNYSQVSESGKQFLKRLSNLTVQSTLFVPDNSGLPDNQVSPRERSADMFLNSASPVSTCPCVPVDPVSAGHRVPSVGRSGSASGPAEERQSDQNSSRQSDGPRSHRPAQPLSSGEVRGSAASWLQLEHRSSLALSGQSLTLVVYGKTSICSCSDLSLWAADHRNTENQTFEVMNLLMVEGSFSAIGDRSNQ